MTVIRDAHKCCLGTEQVLCFMVLKRRAPAGKIIMSTQSGFSDVSLGVTESKAVTFTTPSIRDFASATARNACRKAGCL